MKPIQFRAESHGKFRAFFPYISPATRARKRDVIIVVYRESQTAG